MVSILVLVDLAREYPYKGRGNFYVSSFNPCFSGSCSRIRRRGRLQESTCNVSILVLVDLARESNSDSTLSTFDMKVSILVLVDLARESTSAKTFC